MDQWQPAQIQCWPAVFGDNCILHHHNTPPSKALALSLNPRSSNKSLMEAFNAFAAAVANPSTMKAAQVLGR